MSLRLGVKYKGFFVNAMFQGVSGYQQQLTELYTLESGSLQRFQKYHLTDTWSESNMNATYPRVKIANTNDNNRKASTFWVKDCDFIRLKSLSVGYALPVSVLKKIKLSSASISLQGSNCGIKNRNSMQLRKYIVSFLICGGIFGLSGCDGLFRDAPYNKLSQETIWGSQLLLDEYVLPWYRNMSNGFSIYMPTSSSLLKGACRDYLPWYGDQITISRADWYNTAYGDILNSISSEITRRGLVNWNNYYARIQSVNLLLENEGKIQEGAHKQRILGEAHFFRAYYYYLLLRQFGGPLLIKNNYDPLIDDKKFPRASYEEMVEFIVEEADLAASLLSDKLEASDIGRATKGAALMLKAKTYFWVASKVFQNKEKSYLGFPDDRSDAMLTEAAKACEVQGHISTHSMRKTYGYAANSTLSQSGVPAAQIMETLQAKFRHSDQTTTMRYIGLQQEQIDATALSVDAALGGL